MKTMKATVFHGTNDIRVEEVTRPHAGVGEAVIRVTLTTICGTDLHIVRGEYPVKPGLVIGHEPARIVPGYAAVAGEVLAGLASHSDSCAGSRPMPPAFFGFQTDYQ